MKEARLRTKDDDVHDQDDETNDTASGAVLPHVAMAGGGVDSLLCHGQGDEAGLDEEVERHVVDVMDGVESLVIERVK